MSDVVYTSFLPGATSCAWEAYRIKQESKEQLKDSEKCQGDH